MATLTDDERRAQEWRRSQERQRAAKCAREAKIHGSPAALKQLQEDWAAVGIVLANRDSQWQSDGYEECDE